MNKLSSVMGRPLTKGFKHGNYTNTEFGFSFSDIVPLKSLSESFQQTLQTNVYDKVKSTAENYVGADIVDKLGDKIGTAVVKQGDSLEAKAKEALLNKVGQYASQDNVQNSAIQNSFAAAADQLSKYTIGMKDVYKTQGISGLVKAYPVPFIAGGALAALITARFVLGGRKKVYVQSAANPIKLSKKKVNQIAAQFMANPRTEKPISAAKFDKIQKIINS